MHVYTLASTFLQNYIQTDLLSSYLRPLSKNSLFHHSYRSYSYSSCNFVLSKVVGGSRTPVSAGGDDWTNLEKVITTPIFGFSYFLFQERKETNIAKHSNNDFFQS